MTSETRELKTAEHAGLNALSLQPSLATTRPLPTAPSCPRIHATDAVGLDWSLPSQVHRKDELAPPGSDHFFLSPFERKLG